MARATKVFCMYCEAKMEAGISFCPACGRPTDWATHQERVSFEVQQWRSARHPNGAQTRPTSGGVHAPPPPPPRKRAGAPQAPSAPTVTRVGDLAVHQDAPTPMTSELIATPKAEKKRPLLFGRRKRTERHADDHPTAASLPTPVIERGELSVNGSAPQAPKTDPVAPASPPALLPRAAMPSLAPETPTSAMPPAPSNGSATKRNGSASPSRESVPPSNGSWSRLLSRKDGPAGSAAQNASAVTEHTAPELRTERIDEPVAALSEPAAKKRAAKKPAAKKRAAKKRAAKKPAAKKPAAKKPAAKRSAAEKALKKPPAKRPAAKNPAAKRSVPQTSTTKEPSAGVEATPPSVSPSGNGALEAELLRETITVLRTIGQQMGSLNERISGIEKRLDEQQPSRRSLFRRR